MLSEITVTIKDDEKRLSKKSLQYESYEVSESDPIIQECIRELSKEFNGDPTDITVKITMSIR